MRGEKAHQSRFCRKNQFKAKVTFGLSMLLQCQHLIPALNAWAALVHYTTACPIATQFPWRGCMGDLTIEPSLGKQATWVIAVLDLSFDNLNVGVCTTRHCETSGGLVQKLSVNTVYHKGYGKMAKCTIEELSIKYTIFSNNYVKLMRHPLVYQICYLYLSYLKMKIN